MDVYQTEVFRSHSPCAICGRSLTRNVDLQRDAQGEYLFGRSSHIQEAYGLRPTCDALRLISLAPGAVYLGMACLHGTVRDTLMLERKNCGCPTDSR